MDFLNRPDVTWDVALGTIDLITAAETYRIHLIRPPPVDMFIGYTAEPCIIPARAHTLLHVTVVQNGLALTKKHTITASAAFHFGHGLEVPSVLTTVCGEC